MNSNDLDDLLLMPFIDLQMISKDEVEILDDITAEILVKICILSLKIIFNNDQEALKLIPEELPIQGISKRHRVCNSLAELVKKELNYNKEFGYNQLLYPNDKDTRSLLEHLIEQINNITSKQQQDILLEKEVERKNKEKEGLNVELIDQFHETTYTQSSSINFNTLDDSIIKNALKKSCTNSKWLPIAWRKELNDSRKSQNTIVFSSKNLVTGSILLNDPEISYLNKTGKFLGSNENINLYKSLIENQNVLEHEISYNGEFDEIVKEACSTTSYMEQTSLIKRKLNVMKKTNKSTTDDENINQQEEAKAKEETKENELIVVNEAIDGLRNEYIEAKELKTKNKVENETLGDEILVLEKENRDLEAKYKVKKKTIEMSQDVDKNILIIKDIIKNSKERLNQLHEEWNTFKDPLETQIEQHKAKHLKKKLDSKKKIELMKQMRQDIRETASRLRNQQNEAEDLQKQFSKIKSGTNRSVYTDRILDIIKQIQKQKDDIMLVVADIHGVQHDLNKASGKLKRTEVVADELVFQFTDKNKKSKDVINVQIYRDLTNLRQKFDQLIETNHDIGKIEAEIKQFESKSYQLSTKLNQKNLEQILGDLKQIKEENKLLIAKRKA